MNPPLTVTAAAHAATAPAAIGPAVIVAVALVIVWRFVIFRNGKGTPAGRLMAVLLALVAFWALLAVARPTAAGAMAAGAASGLATLLAGVGRLVGA